MTRPLPVSSTPRQQLPFPRSIGQGKELEYKDRIGADLNGYEKQGLENYRLGKGAHSAPLDLRDTLNNHQRACLELYQELLKQQLAQKL